MMQFSVAPWRGLDSTHLEAVRKAISIREHFVDYIMTVVKESKEQCTPILRPLEYSFPAANYITVNQQFMIGDKLLVAPVLKKGSAKHEVIIPPGNWKGYDGKTYSGTETYVFSVKLADIPYFEKIN